MAGNRRDDEGRGGVTGPDDALSERFIDEGERSPEAIPAAAREAFEADQREDPDHPTRIRRRLADEAGIQDPAHSKGTGGTGPASAAPAGDEPHANRDRSDLRGSPARPAERTGETGSGRSASNSPAAGRSRRSREGEG